MNYGVPIDIRQIIVQNERVLKIKQSTINYEMRIADKTFWNSIDQSDVINKMFRIHNK